MLLALGPHQLDTTARTVVVGVVSSPGTGSLERAATGADAVWLRGPGTADEVARACRHGRLPVGVTVDDLTRLDDVVAAGAVAIESASPDVVGAAAERRLALWCTPEQARFAIDLGVPAEHIVREGDGPGVPAATVAGDGPATWGAVVRAVHAGARVVRTTDVRSVRRVVTVTDRLRAARAAAQPDDAP